MLDGGSADLGAANRMHSLFVRRCHRRTLERGRPWLALSTYARTREECNALAFWMASRLVYVVTRSAGPPPSACGVGSGGRESPSLLPPLWCGVWCVAPSPMWCRVWWVGFPLPPSFLSVVWGLVRGNPSGVDPWLEVLVGSTPWSFQSGVSGWS